MIKTPITGPLLWGMGGRGSLRTGSPKLPETGAKRRPRGVRKKIWEACSQVREGEGVGDGANPPQEDFGP